MKVFITYPTDGQIDLINGLFKSLETYGVDTLVWNRNTGKYITNNESRFDKNIKALKSFKNLNRYIKGVILRTPILMSFFVKRFFAGIDIVNYHFQDYFCDKIIRANKGNGPKLLVSIWGSDLYRISDKTIMQRKSLYDKVSLIHVESPEVKNDFLAKYMIDNNKVFCCNFGIGLFHNIDKVRSLKEDLKRKLLPESAVGKIIITCGYNGRRGQQHTKIINELNKMPESYRNSVFAIFPLTYADEADTFMDEIDEALLNLKVPYATFKRMLKSDELAELRVVSDMVVNIQITDSLSSSLMEYYYSGNIMLLGDWLPYKFLSEDNGMSYIPITCENMHEKIVEVIDHYDSYKEIAKRNVENTYKFASWDCVSEKLYSMFKYLIKNDIFICNSILFKICFVLCILVY